MDRFDEMRTKGINTNDATATAEDVLEGKTAYVGGRKITGAFIPSTGADLTEIGTPVLVSSLDTIPKGGTFSGIKNEEYTPILSAITRNNLPTRLSDDYEVGINLSQNISSSSTEINIYFYNSETTSYDIVAVPLPEFTTSNNLTQAEINNAGDLAIIYYKGTNNTTTAYIVIEIDRENKTGTPYVFYMTSSYNLTQNSPQVLYGNMIIFSVSDAARYDKETHQIISLTKSVSFSFTRNNLQSYSTIQSSSGRVIACGNKIVGPVSGGIAVHTIDETNNTVSYTKIPLYSSYSGGTIISISRDGKKATYLDSTKTTSAANCRIYNLDLDNLKAEYYMTHSGIGPALVDGTKIWRNGLIIDISDPNNLKTLATVSTTYPWRTNGFNINLFYSDKLYYLPVVDDSAEYVIEKASAGMEINKIYGIASSYLNIGDTGIAQMLFNTYTEE